VHCVGFHLLMRDLPGAGAVLGWIAARARQRKAPQCEACSVPLGIARALAGDDHRYLAGPARPAPGGPTPSKVQRFILLMTVMRIVVSVVALMPCCRPRHDARGG